MVNRGSKVLKLYLPLGIADVVLFEVLGNVGDGGVDGVGDDQDKANGSNTGCQISDNASVDLDGLLSN
jgi:hypothetical protein